MRSPNVMTKWSKVEIISRKLKKNDNFMLLNPKNIKICFAETGEGEG